jgi:ribonuclease VapC
MFVDTSAIIAMIIGEDQSERLEAELNQTVRRITSAVVIIEATMVLSTKSRISPLSAESIIRFFLDKAGIVTVEINDETASQAVVAFARFGKGQGNAAKLNLADCLTYACAKQQGMPILYVGNDFAQTDMA